MPSFKIIIAEKDGVEFEYNTEYDLLQALTELGISEGAENFSFHKVAQDDSVLIPSNQHMICTSVEVDGFLDVEGGLVFL
jgi:hypothetical protein